jgi:hypothetical protein
MSIKHFLVAGALSGVLFAGGAAVAWAQTTTPTDPPSTTTPSSPEQTPSTPPEAPKGRSHNCPDKGTDDGSGASSSSASDSNVSMRGHRSAPSRRL